MSDESLSRKLRGRAWPSTDTAETDTAETLGAGPRGEVTLGTKRFEVCSALSRPRDALAL